MPRKDAQISVLAGNLNFRRRRVYDFLFRRNDFELESIGHLSLVVSKTALGRSVVAIHEWFGQRLMTDD